MNLNKVTLIGNLTGDPRSNDLPSGQTVTTFGVATNHRWRDYRTKETREAVEFHHVVAWRKLGEVVSKYLKKGDRVFLEGRLQTRSWNDKTGSRKSRTEIVADNLIMLGKRTGAKTAKKPDDEMVQEEVSIEEVPVS